MVIFSADRQIISKYIDWLSLGTTQMTHLLCFFQDESSEGSGT